MQLISLERIEVRVQDDVSIAHDQQTVNWNFMLLYVVVPDQVKS